MRRSVRVRRHLNFKKFHSTGEKVYKDSEAVTPVEGGSEQSIKMENPAERLQALQIQIQTVDGDLADFLEEYDVREMEPNIDDLDKVSQRAEEFRSILREKHRLVGRMMGPEAYEDEYGQSLDKNLQNIKEYILRVNELRKQIRQVANLRQANEDEGNEKYFTFIRDELWTQFRRH